MAAVAANFCGCSLAPYISGMTPSRGLQGTQGLHVSITGSNLSGGVVLVNGVIGGDAGDVSVASVTEVSSQELDVVLNIAPDAPRTAYDIAVGVPMQSLSEPASFFVDNTNGIPTPYIDLVEVAPPGQFPVPTLFSSYQDMASRIFLPWSSMDTESRSTK